MCRSVCAHLYLCFALVSITDIFCNLHCCWSAEATATVREFHKLQLCIISFVGVAVSASRGTGAHLCATRETQFQREASSKRQGTSKEGMGFYDCQRLLLHLLLCWCVPRTKMQFKMFSATKQVNICKRLQLLLLSCWNRSM